MSAERQRRCLNRTVRRGLPRIARMVMALLDVDKGRLSFEERRELKAAAVYVSYLAVRDNLPRRKPVGRPFGSLVDDSKRAEVSNG